ncbi:MAG: hypothetical protein M3R35_00240 [Candidatus Eremiobacteraeota bacterium]|nr:hypothetical protein [Candidatus Eremiobacteraeota bacterium]
MGLDDHAGNAAYDLRRYDVRIGYFFAEGSEYVARFETLYYRRLVIAAQADEYLVVGICCPSSDLFRSRHFAPT